MEDNLNSQLFAFDSAGNQSSYIKVIGVGGGGNNAVNHMYRKGIQGVDFIVSNTDMKALNGSPVPTKLVLGHEGLGVGGRPEKARKAAQEKESEIKELFNRDTKMVFITAGMGGGTGTGAAPVIAQYAKEIKLQAEDVDDPDSILVVAVVTTPFMFEGNRRIQQALHGVEELRKHVDSILVINNEKLRSYGNLGMSDAFAMANDVLLTAVKGIAEIITLNAYINIDFRDVNTVMEKSGTALMGIGEGEGEGRALKAVEEAATSVLLNDNNITGAKNVLLYFSYSPEHEITMDEMGEVTDYITNCTGGLDTNVIWGTGTDDTLGDKVKITLIATGFEQSEASEGRTILLESEKPSANPTAKPSPLTEPTIVHRSEPAPAVQPAAPVSAAPAPATAVETAPVPETAQAFAPASAAPEAAPTPVPETPRRVIPLYSPEELKAEAKLPEMVEDDGLRIVSRKSEDPVQPAAPAQPVAAPQPRGYSAPSSAALPEERHIAQAVEALERQAATRRRLDIETMNRADRIKAMHDLLRGDVNGAAMVEAMNPLELTGDTLFEAAHSSETESRQASVESDGSMKHNLYLYDNPD